MTDFWSLPKGPLCKRCGMGYLGRRRIMRSNCPTPGCDLATTRRLIPPAEASHLEQEGDVYHVYGLRGVTLWRRAACILGAVFLTPAPASDVVWCWVEVDA